MQKGYLPYEDTFQEDRTSHRAPQLSFEFATHDVATDPSREQLEEFYRAVKEFVESKRQLRMAGGSARLVDAFYSFNILPPRNIKKYLHKSGIHDSAADSLHSDWQKVGLDLWSSTLGEHLKRVASE